MGAGDPNSGLHAPLEMLYSLGCLPSPTQRTLLINSGCAFPGRECFAHTASGTWEVGP